MGDSSDGIFDDHVHVIRRRIENQVAFLEVSRCRCGDVVRSLASTG